MLRRISFLGEIDQHHFRGKDEVIRELQIDQGN
jgi:hypothetical protein